MKYRDRTPDKTITKSFSFPPSVIKVLDWLIEEETKVRGNVSASSILSEVILQAAKKRSYAK